MKSLRLIPFAFVAGIAWVDPLCAQAPAPIQLALTLNDGTTSQAYRGWPLVLRGDAVLMEYGGPPTSLEPAALRLTVTASGAGPAVSWPWRLTTDFPAPPVLGPTNDGVRVTWVLTAAQTLALPPGDYGVTLGWAGRTSPALAFNLTEAPSPLSADQEESRSLLQSEAAQLLGDTAGALAALTAIEAKRPQSISVLVQRARVHLVRGESREALGAAQRALTVYHRDHPNPTHPPASILEVESKARAQLIKSIPPGPRIPGLPGGPPRTVSNVPSSAVVPTPPAPAQPTPTAPTSGGTPPTISPSSPSSGINVPASNGPRVGAAAAGIVEPAAGLDDVKIRAESAGQWAATARAGSSYSSPGYAAAKATGEPNVPVVGDSAEAWCPGQQNTGTDWLEVSFARPRRAIGVRVRQTHTPGALVKVEAFEPDGTLHLWWQGTDPYVAPPVRAVAWFGVRVPPTAYEVARVKLTLNLAAVPGWKQIDAVQLVAAP